MATLTLLTGANSDDISVGDVNLSAETVRLGAVGSAVAGHGNGFSFPSVTLAGTETLNNAYLSLMKQLTPGFSQAVAYRIVAVDEDNRGSFTTTSPNRPGDPAIVSAEIGAGSISEVRTNGVRYEFPPSSASAQRVNLGESLQVVIDRGGWSSGNSICVVDNSDQDASANTNFDRADFKAHNHTDADSEPTLVIDYTVATAGQPTMMRWGGIHNMPRTQRQRRGW